MPFQDIFSKKKTSSSKPKIKITVDHREKNSLVPTELSSLGFQIEFKQLEIGDYIINNTIIERKTSSDLKSSIINKRIFSQLENLKQHQSTLLLIEQDENHSPSAIHENAIRGFLLATTLDFQIPLIFTQDSSETAQYLSVLAKRDPNKEISIRFSKILKTKEEQIQFILEGFPNIGPKKAKLLLEKFKSLKNIFKASEKDLEKVLGKKAKEFKNLLN